MDTPFFTPDRRRATLPEIVSYIEEQIDATPVVAVGDVVDAGDARTGNERMSNYQEMHRRDEWLLPLTAKNGVVLRTAEIPATDCSQIAFVLSLGFGNGSPLPQPTGQFHLSVNGKAAVSIRVVNHRQLWRRADCALAFDAKRVECAEPCAGLTLSPLITNEMLAAFGPAFLVVPKSWVTPGSTAEIRVDAECDVESTRWLLLANSGQVLQQSDFHRLVDMLREPHPAVGDYKVYFGDIHTHSGQVRDKCDNKGCGMGSWAGNYEYARGPGGLDIYALTDHESQVDPDDNEAYLGLADKYNEDGRFVCLPAYEFTNPLYGHRNVYFRGSGGAVLDTARDPGRTSMDPANCRTPDELWAAMEATGVPFITIPHHPSATSHPMNLDFHNPKYDRLLEVYSSWGSSEYHGDFPRGVSDRWRTNSYREALIRGQRYGVLGGADGHDGHPGNAQSPLVKHHHLFHFCGSGRIAVLAEELTREAVFDAMYERRCYATTGPPIVLEVKVNGAVMGSEIPVLGVGERPAVICRVDGTAGIDHIRFMKNGDVVHTVHCHGEWAFEAQWEDDNYGAADASCYWVRVVQNDHESAWSSPVWIG